MDLKSKIEAVLFWKGEPMPRKKLCDILGAELEKVNEALESLKGEYGGKGIVLQEIGNDVAFGTAPDLSKLFEDLAKEELNKELSKASLETLSIVLYKDGATRAEIDYIRGVNSSFTLRALSVRGLVEKTVYKEDSRRFVYKPSLELISYLGLRSAEELPDFSEISASIKNTAENMNNEEAKS